MKPRTTEDVLELLDGCVRSVVLGAAMELGVFWLLEDKILSTQEIAEELDLPLNRCRYFLHLLVKLGLIEEMPGGFQSSPTTQKTILDVYHQDTWAFLAQEARERLPTLQDLALHIRQPGSILDILNFSPPGYVSQMDENPERAKRFTYMLYELHRELADGLAEILDVGSSKRMLDLGGGSGVVSLSLLQKHPQLTAVVVDIPNVCAAGREIAIENGMRDRITYIPADFLHDELPSGFDFILECDVNVYSEELFRKVWGCLNPRGRFVIVDQLAPQDGFAPYARLDWAFYGSLRDPDFAYPTARQLGSMLELAGFQEVKLHDLSASETAETKFLQDMVMLEAFRGMDHNH